MHWLTNIWKTLKNCLIWNECCFKNQVKKFAGYALVNISLISSQTSACYAFNYTIVNGDVEFRFERSKVYYRCENWVDNEESEIFFYILFSVFRRFIYISDVFVWSAKKKTVWKDLFEK